ADIRAQVEYLLACDEQANDFIETPVLSLAAQVFEAQDSEPIEGNRIGAYKILREIGRGGMGTVYLAVRDDDEYERQVAIKLIKRGMDTDLVLRRFRNERQILAHLDQPNIAKLHDGGTTKDGRPYFVMEYIEGMPITEYCELHNFPTIERLKLFRKACSAVEHAHRNLVVHRDIKPANILVTAEGAPKLLDFGIAKLLNPDAADLTATMLRVMTPEYASPEQVKGDNVSTATDVYSLGVLFYELLTGCRPYRVKRRTPEEIARAVCDQEPIKPSEAVSSRLSVSSSHKGTSDNGHQNTSQFTIRNPKFLRGDLDNIALMAMRKEPDRRYKSVEQFSEDVHRYLEGLTVIARQDTFLYRTGKFIKRNKLSVAAAVLIALTLVFGVIATAWEARAARKEQARAEAEKARAEQRLQDVRRLAHAVVFDY